MQADAEDAAQLVLPSRHEYWVQPQHDMKTGMVTYAS